MTTLTYAAHTVTMNASDVVTSVTPSQVSLTVGNDFLFAYFYQQIFGQDFESSLGARVFTVRVDGVVVDNTEVNVGMLSWAGGSGVYMAVEVGTSATLVWMGGQQVPQSIMTNLAQLTALSQTWSPVPATNEFTPNDDILLTAFEALTGISENDVAFGNEFNNTRIRMTEGNDRYEAGAGNDEVYGGADNDSLYGDAGFDTLYGDEGNDQLFGGADGDDLYTGLGNDLAYGGEGYDDLYGDAGNDSLYGGGLGDYILGEAGNDQIFGDAGNDSRLDGGAGNDSIRGGSGQDVLVGGTGRDTLNGDAGADYLVGGAQADRFTFLAGMGRDVVRDFDITEGDRLAIHRSVLDGQTGLTTAQIFAQYGTDLGDSLQFNFGNGNKLTLLGVADLAELGNAFQIL